MIGFGELRRLSLQWQADLATVEHAYAVDWLLKALYDQPLFADTLVLRGSAALRYAHSADYPSVEEPEFLAAAPADDSRREAFQSAVKSAAAASGAQFALVDLQPGSARVEYTGPLGRRSAAQPHIVVSLVAGRPRLPAARVPLVHPFSDRCEGIVSAVSLEEFAAERIAGLAGGPRVRDVFDLWFALVRLGDRVDRPRARELAARIAPDGRTLPGPHGLFDPAQRPALERAWDAALRRMPGHPTFTQVEQELRDALE